MKYVTFLIILLSAYAHQALANNHIPPAAGNPPANNNITAVKEWGPGSFQEVITAILQAVQAIGTLAIAVMLVWSGFLFVTSGGDTQKLTQARQAFFWTLIGAAIILGAVGIEASIRETIDPTLGP